MVHFFIKEQRFTPLNPKRDTADAQKPRKTGFKTFNLGSLQLCGLYGRTQVAKEEFNKTEIAK